jgi:hypothetical protein
LELAVFAVETAVAELESAVALWDNAVLLVLVAVVEAVKALFAVDVAVAALLLDSWVTYRFCVKLSFRSEDRIADPG